MAELLFAVDDDGSTSSGLDDDAARININDDLHLAVDAEPPAMSSSSSTEMGPRIAAVGKSRASQIIQLRATLSGRLLGPRDMLSTMRFWARPSIGRQIHP